MRVGNSSIEADAETEEVEAAEAVVVVLRMNERGGEG